MFALEIFKWLYDFNPSFISSTFNIKNVPYSCRDNTISKILLMVEDLSNITGTCLEPYTCRNKSIQKHYNIPDVERSAVSM